MVFCQPSMPSFVSCFIRSASAFLVPVESPAPLSQSLTKTEQKEASNERAGPYLYIIRVLSLPSFLVFQEAGTTKLLLAY